MCGVFVAVLRQNCERLTVKESKIFGVLSLKNIILIALIASVLSGCATVTRGTTNDIQITSEPTGASAKTSMSQTCLTPCIIKMGRKDEFQVVFNKDGYKEAVIPVKTQIAGAGVAGAAGNVLVGGFVGLGVDMYSGATLEHSPNPVHAVLEPLKADNKAIASRKKGKMKQQKKIDPVVESTVEDAPVEPSS